MFLFIGRHEYNSRMAQPNIISEIKKMIDDGGTKYGVHYRYIYSTAATLLDVAASSDDEMLRNLTDAKAAATTLASLVGAIWEILPDEYAAFGKVSFSQHPYRLAEAENGTKYWTNTP